MFEFCITIGGQRHCFEIPAMIDRSVIKRPPPNNMPPFELAAAVLLLVEAAPHSELAKQLSGGARHKNGRIMRRVSGKPSSPQTSD
jgi:hypothetical protein